MKHVVAVYFELTSEEELSILKHWLDTHCRFPLLCDKMVEGTISEVKDFLKEN